MVDVEVDGESMSVPDDVSLFHALRAQGKHVPGLCNLPELNGYGACRLCLINVDGKVQTACTVHASPGAKVETLNEDIVAMRQTALNLLLSDHQGDCIGPCQRGCPAHSDVQGYLALIAMGRYHEAVCLMKKRYILPAVLGRVCPAFCEDECRRHLVDEPVGIREVKRFAADYDLGHGPWMPEIPAATGKGVAVVGGGPAGLSCAYYLRVRGHAVTIFEAMEELGGMMRYGIPEYRLPKDVLDQDIATVIDTGIEVRTSCWVGKDISVEELRETFDAVFLGIGAWHPKTMGLPGENLSGVMQGIEFLQQVNQNKHISLGSKVMVVGGGNTAIDVARSAVRLGAEVHVVYRRSREEMPAEPREIKEAEEEGVTFHFLTNPVKLWGKESVSRVELVKMQQGEPDSSGRPRPVPIKNSNYFMEADTVIFAVGQHTDVAGLQMPLLADAGRLICNDTTCQTGLPGVFAGGDALLGPSTIIESIASGRRAAVMIDCYLQGKLLMAEKTLSNPSSFIADISADETLQQLLFEFRPYNHWKDLSPSDYMHIEKVARKKPRLLKPEERSTNFNEVEQTLSEAAVTHEAGRCLSCGCMAVHKCKLREYATLYEAEQHVFDGQQNHMELDTSHPYVALDNNKCVLCGQCVNTTQKITLEGILDYMSRGFATHVAPPIGTTLQDVEGQFLGDLVDVCPTGALTDRPPFDKPGPWKTTATATICNGCGLGCEMNIEHYGDLAIRAASKTPSWNKGHVCDKGRFGRRWNQGVNAPRIKRQHQWTEISWKEAIQVLHDRMKDMAIVVGPDATLEEAAHLKNMAESYHMPIGADAAEGISTATLGDISIASRIMIAADTKKYPYLAMLLQQALRNGAQLVTDNYDLAILEAPAQPLEVPTLILHHGVNETGLLHMGLKAAPQAKNYLVVGSPRQRLNGFVISLGHFDYADMMLPYPSWIEKDGTVINDFNMELSLHKVREKAVGIERYLWFEEPAVTAAD